MAVVWKRIKAGVLLRRSSPGPKMEKSVAGGSLGCVETY